MEIITMGEPYLAEYSEKRNSPSPTIDEKHSQLIKILNDEGFNRPILNQFNPIVEKYYNAKDVAEVIKSKREGGNPSYGIPYHDENFVGIFVKFKKERKEKLIKKLDEWKIPNNL